MLSRTLRAVHASPLGATARCMSSITDIYSRQIIDSRGNPTVEVDVRTSDGLFRASVPSGASTGIYEAIELRDGGAPFGGKGVTNAVRNINEVLAPKLKGMDTTNQKAVDEAMFDIDGTDNKAKMGANAILGISLAVAKAGAGAKKVPLWQHIADLANKTEGPILPVPSLNVINGGEHAGNLLAFQEFMILPIGASSFSEGLQMGCEVYQRLKAVIKKTYGQDAINVGDEGGFAPNIHSAREGLELLSEAIESAGYTGQVALGLDAAASEFQTAEKDYDLNFKDSKNPQKVTRQQLAEEYVALCSDFPIISIEDPFEQDDWEGFVELTKRIGEHVQIVGDDLLVTNPSRIKTAIEKTACNALLLKVNQIGSVTESIQACLDSQNAGWGVMVSHRSGETEDHYIADFAVGLRTGQIKTGAPCRSERLSKYNQLLRIEEEIKRTTGSEPGYAGRNFRKP